tara:strand:+ start:8601 stop:9530 length:930 start_codon:yes stop_codon:yes gene_type:complete
MADITASRLNNLQLRVSNIFGNGTSQSGYGQTVSSSQVSVGDTITASQINLIYADIVKTRVHQTGLIPPSIGSVITNSNVVAESTSYFVNSSGITVVDPTGGAKGLSDFESLMTQIESDKFLIDSSQAALESGTSSSRQSQWNGIINHEFKVEFVSSNHRRHFFNSGGAIRFSATNTSSSTPKGRDWTALLEEMGTVSFNYNSTTTNNTGVGQPIGNYNLLTNYTRIYQKVGAGSYSGIYAGNLLSLDAKEIDNKTIQFRLQFNDIAVDNRIDNNVDGYLTTLIQHYRADTSNVTVNAPSYIAVTALTA